MPKEANATRGNHPGVEISGGGNIAWELIFGAVPALLSVVLAVFASAYVGMPVPF